MGNEAGGGDADDACKRTFVRGLEQKAVEVRKAGGLEATGWSEDAETVELS